MPSSFRPVALRLPLSCVAALAEATARALFDRSGRVGDRIAVAFAFRLQAPATASPLRELAPMGGKPVRG